MSTLDKNNFGLKTFVQTYIIQILSKIHFLII